MHGVGIVSRSSDLLTCYAILATTCYVVAGVVGEEDGLAGAIAMREAEELSHVIGDIYDASLDPALWPTALESV